MNIFQVIGYVLVQLWEIFVAIFIGIIALLQIIVNIIVAFVTAVINLFGFIPWLVPSCLLPIFYVSIVVYAIKFFVDINSKKGGL